MTRTRQTVRQIFLIPAILAIFSLGGLVFALVEDVGRAVLDSAISSNRAVRWLYCAWPSTVD